MSVLEGPRREVRRVLVNGHAERCEARDDVLVLEDGRTVGSDAVHLPPVIPATIVCVHLNYRSRAEEFGVKLAEGHPTYFVKPCTAINAHGGDVQRPSDCRLLNYEGELAAVVGRTMRRARPEQVWEDLAGFSCANDFGIHDFRDTDAGSMLRVKGQDGFCPIGPGVVSGVDVRRSVLRTFVNGRKVQEGAVAEMLWGIDDLIADLTRHVTLRPGDVVLTGTPWHSRPVFPGDVVEVEIDGVGRLTNRVVEIEAPENLRGFPATVTKTSLGVALGCDYHLLKTPEAPPTPEQYERMRYELAARNMEAGPPRREAR